MLRELTCREKADQAAGRRHVLLFVKLAGRSVGLFRSVRYQHSAPVIPAGSAGGKGAAAPNLRDRS